MEGSMGAGASGASSKVEATQALRSVEEEEEGNDDQVTWHAGKVEKQIREISDGGAAADVSAREIDEDRPRDGRDERCSP